MTNQIATYNGINATQRRTIATTTKRKQLQAEALESTQMDYCAPLTLSDIAWTTAILSGFLISIIFTIIMIWGVL